jgi:hypothetical protein
MQWNQFKSFWYNPVHNSTKITLDSERCCILWVSLFIAPHFKIRSFPFVWRHWQDQKTEVCARTFNRLSCRFFNNWWHIPCNSCSISCMIFQSRGRAARHYLSTGSLALSPEDILFLDQNNVFGKISSQWVWS